MVAVPVKPRSTVTGNPKVADSVAVNVATPLASAILALLTDSVTLGGAENDSTS